MTDASSILVTRSEWLSARSEPLSAPRSLVSREQLLIFRAIGVPLTRRGKDSGRALAVLALLVLRAGVDGVRDEMVGAAGPASAPRSALEARAAHAGPLPHGQDSSMPHRSGLRVAVFLGVRRSARSTSSRVPRQCRSSARIHTDTWAGSRAFCTAAARSSRTESRSTASFS